MVGGVLVRVLVRVLVLHKKTQNAGARSRSRRVLVSWRGRYVVPGGGTRDKAHAAEPDYGYPEWTKRRVIRAVPPLRAQARGAVAELLLRCCPAAVGTCTRGGVG